MLLILQKAGNVGFQTKGYHACFLCVDDLGVRYSPNLRKVVYTTFRKLLPLHHPFHTTLKIFFNGANEKSPRPTQCTTQEWMDLWNTTSANHPEGMKRFSCFYDLKYWVHNTIHHLLDPVHIVKNVCHSLISHLLGEKESAKAWTDLEAWNLKKEFWKHEDGSYKVGSWVFSKSEQKTFFVVLKSIKAPAGYGVDLRNAINKKNHFISLKTHDFFNMLLYTLSLVIKGLIITRVCETIARLSILYDGCVLRKFISKNFW